MGLVNFLLRNKMQAEITVAIKQGRLTFVGTDQVSYVDRNGRKTQLPLARMAQHLADKFAEGIEKANLRAGTSVHSGVTGDDVKSMLLKASQKQRGRAKP